MNFEQNGLEVAIIGMSGRFPGSENVELFWKNLVKGAEFISAFSGVENQELDTNPNSYYQDIKAGGVLDNIDMFDASFFGFSPREAAMIDPQHRLLLECAWEALEKAGYDSETESRPIGVYGGIGSSTYLLYNLFPNNFKESLGYFPTLLASDRDYAPTRVSYKLNLTGPSVSVGTACSSSLVAVHLAYKGLLSGECDIALAAGVAVKTPQNEVTLCPEGISPHGRCFAFDARANGTIGGNGVGVVVLKRLEDALADRDYIYAVIKGSAINNDGACKVSYTAPSENAQAKVICSAQIMADVEPETITYIETHGTGTPMGDPIEIAALKQAFQGSTDQKGYLDLIDVLYPNKNQSEKSSPSTKPTSRLNLRQMLGRDSEQPDVASEKLNQTYLTQPAFFVIEYALAQLLLKWGIRPTAMIGYSIGEYVAACLAGVLSLEDALTLVATRAKMIQELPSGAMLAVPLSEAEVVPLLNEKLSLSAINGAKLCVVAGTTDTVEELAAQLTEKGLVCRRLQTSHAFHSYMMEAIATPFTEQGKRTLKWHRHD
jgi:acyl transferase domain-containing protein